MELKLVKEDFADNFLNILGKAVDSASIKINNEGMYVVCNKPETSIILLAKYKRAIEIESEISLNIGDIKKLVRVLDCIKSEEIIFNIKDNHMYYKSPEIQFKYHFLDDSIIPKATLKKEKIEALVLDTFFEIDYRKLHDVLKASSFTVESTKIYVYGQPDGVYCELGDREKCNTDSISFKISDKIEGTPFTQVIPFDLDIFRILSGVKFEKARIGLNLTHKVMSFYVAPTPDTEFRFIISGLVK